MKEFNKDNLPKQGDMIEVSITSKIWQKKKFAFYDGQHCWCYHEKNNEARAWAHARPIAKPEPKMYDRVKRVGGWEGNVIISVNGSKYRVIMDDRSYSKWLDLETFHTLFEIIETGFHLVNVDKLIKEIEGINLLDSGGAVRLQIINKLKTLKK